MHRFEKAVAGNGDCAPGGYSRDRGVMADGDETIAHAFWETGESGLIILARDWASTTALPPLFLGPVNRPFRKLERLSHAECGRYTRYYRRKNSWIFVLQSKRYPQLLDREVRVFLAGDFNGWGEAIGQAKWELRPATDAASTVYELCLPHRSLPKDSRSQFKFVTDRGEWLDVPDSAPNAIHREDGVCNFEFNPAQSGRHIFRFQVPEDYEPVGTEQILWRHAAGVEEVHELPHTQFLLRAESELELGARVEAGATRFRLFAPRAQAVKVAVATRADESDAQFFDLEAVHGGVWELRLEDDLSGRFYSYRVLGTSREGTSHFDGSFPVLDPYAKACVGRRGPGIILAADRLQKVERPFEAPPWHDLVILEGHVRDLAAHAPIDLAPGARRGYTGLRQWLETDGSYLREIGVNAVELQPVQEFDNPDAEAYHWGYMTVNYFSPESSYALHPERGSQVEEFRELVRAFHDAGMAVILDVVYNHVGEPNHLLFIDKFYYFHLDEANDLVNWSGCGNDLRCDTPMARRLIVESLKHLVEVYDVDGFRFDLAELIGIEVLREVEAALKAVKPSVILIAEPWSFRGHIMDALKETGFASWNDGFRESIAQYVQAEGNQEMIRHFLSGSPGSTRFAAQTINYTESHDDYCWLDRITERSRQDGSDPTLLDRRRTHLMLSILMVSLGVPMLAAGQDFLRSKYGVSNTYQRGDLNALDYNRRLMFSGTHAYAKAWIELRRSALGRPLRYDGGVGDGYVKCFFTEGSSAVVAVFNADRSREGGALVYGINPHFNYATIECDELDTGRLRQIADHERVVPEGLDSARIQMDGARIHLPPLSCGLWTLPS